jgi:hypothetical protein
MFTDKQLNIILVKSNHYYQQHIQGQEDKTWQPDISFDELYHFYSSDNPDGIWWLGHDKRLLANQTNELHYTPLYSEVTKCM